MKKTIFFLLMGMWMFFAVFFVGYNMIFSISEVKNWYFLSDSEKRHKIFGDVYEFVVFVDKHTEKNAQIFLQSDDGFAFYLARYYLYPKRIFWSESTHDRGLNHVKYQYFVTNKKQIEKKGFALTAELLQKQSHTSWYIYKRHE